MGHIILLICCHAQALNKMIINFFFFFIQILGIHVMICVKERIQIQTIHQQYVSLFSVAIVTIKIFAVKQFYNKFYGSDIKCSLALTGFVIDCDMPCFR